jgi:hypothetical protein
VLKRPDGRSRPQRNPPPIKIINERVDHDRHTAPEPGKHRTVLSLLGYRLGVPKQ